jgi:hypothetical protein
VEHFYHKMFWLRRLQRLSCAVQHRASRNVLHPLTRGRCAARSGFNFIASTETLSARDRASPRAIAKPPGMVREVDMGGTFLS